jgi:hypothetical protein
MEDYKKISECRVCGSDKLRSYLDLGSVPLANALLDPFSKDASKYPLNVLYCRDCSLSQLSIIVDPKIMFSEYFYKSSVSETFKDHCREMGRDLFELRGIPRPHVIDIASNDGCLLEQFRDEGFSVLGVDPATNLSKISKDKGIETINKFWGEDIILDRRADVITATNVIAHVDDLDGFVKGVVNNLNPMGIFVMEFPWALNLISNGLFDTIYHEHLSYFLLKPLKIKLEQHGMKVFKVSAVDIHGGSLRVYACNDKMYREDDSVKMVEDIEKSCGMYNESKYIVYRETVECVKNQFIRMMECLRGCNVYGYGASAKGIMLMNACGLTRDDIMGIADDTTEKQGKETPGGRIPIITLERMREMNPHTIILFAWNFAEELKMRTSDYRGRYLIPLPWARFDDARERIGV